MAERNPHGFIQTYTGKRFWPLDPVAADLDIRDIAHALSQNCRWTGHCRDFYSVAQHCVYCSYVVPENLTLTALMHDASEAYLSDLSRPVKHSPELVGYRDAERKLETIIAETFELVFPYPPEVKQADNRMLYTERRDLLVGSVEWTTDRENVLGFEGNDRQPYDFRITSWEPKEAEQLFLERFHALTNGKYKAS